MNVKKYIAANSREALRQVKNELGDDAVILSNRQTANGVEIMALASTDISNLAANPEPSAKIHKDGKNRVCLSAITDNQVSGAAD